NNYEITYDFGRLEIIPRPITIETLSNEKVYDGLALNQLNYLVTENQLLETHTIKVVDHTSITNVGEIENRLMIEIYDGFVNVTDNYEISYDYEMLKVTPKPICIKPVDKLKVYDGVVLTSNEAELIDSTELVKNHHITITTTQSLIYVDKVDNLIISHEIFDNQVNVTDNYEVTYQPGILEITPRLITIKPVDKTKVYDDTELVSIEAELVDSTTLASNDVIYITTDGSIINVGNIENTILSHQIFTGAVDVTDNYIVDYHSGSLEIIHRPITIKPVDITKEYDGIAFTSNEIEFLDDTSLVVSHEIFVTTSGSITDVSKVDNLILAHLIYKDEVDVTENYAVTYQLGSLEVSPRLITIKPKDELKVYNKLALTSNIVEFLDSTDLVNDHQITITTEGYLIDVDKIDNRILSHQIFSGEVDVSSNYKVTYQVGTLEITPRPITIKPIDKTKEYDDTTLTSNEIEFLNLTQLMEGHSISIITNGSINDVGVVDNQIIEAIIKEGTREVTFNYSIITEKGLLTITPRLITIETGSNTKVYDGTELIEHLNYDLDNKLVVGHTIVIFSDTSIIDVYKIENILTIQIFKDTKEVTANYDISYVYGFLEVTPRPLYIKPVDKTKEYDGTALLSNEVAYLSLSEIVLGHEITITTSGRITNVGVVENEILTTIIKEGTREVTFNYSIITEKGFLTITPRLITIETESKEKVYDGIELINHQYYVLDDRLVIGHVSVITSDTGITNVGATKNILTIDIYDGEINVTSNYEISYIYGTLKISPRPITIKPADKTKVYDGTPLTSNEVVFLHATELVSGQQIFITTNGVITNVGIIDNEITTVVIMAGAIDVSFNYTVTFEKGLLEITPRLITIETGSSDKVYDGLELFNLNYNIIENTLVAGQVISVEFFTSMTNVGVVDNILSLVIFDNLKEVTFNYEISYEYGILEITQRLITIKTASNQRVYNGLEFFDHTHEIIEG
ncbi:MAG: hypothetical protein WC939_05580, partial [Acholeplasmataceae bacterium]